MTVKELLKALDSVLAVGGEDFTVELQVESGERYVSGGCRTVVIRQADGIIVLTERVK